MSVAKENPVASSVANGVATVFPHAFTVLAAGDLVVKGTLNGVTTVYVYGLHYSITELGEPAGSVVFNAAPAAGTVVDRYRISQMVRYVDYQNNGDLRATTLNDDIDRIWLALQELNSRSASAVRAPYPEELDELPGPDARMGRLLGFNAASGAPELSSVTLTQLASAVAAAYSGAAGPLDALSFVQAGAGAVSRSAQNKLREVEVSVVDYYNAATDGNDWRPAATRAVALLALNGGGRLVFPYRGGYQISDAIVVSSSNIVIELQDDVTLTKTSATSASPCSAFRFIGTTAAYIENVGLVAPRRVTVDCNGRNVIGYAHVGGSSSAVADHHGVLFRFCKNIRSQNVYAYNGLIGCFTAQYCLGGAVVNPDVSHSVYDNGLYVFNNGEHVAPFDAEDPSTWSNVTVLNLRAWNCANHGGGSFGAVGVTYINPKIWSCGNNTGAADAGPAGGLGVEYDGANPARDYHFTAINPQVVGSYGFGIRTNCKGTKIKGGFVRRTRIPTAYADSGASPIWGSGLFVQSGAADCEFDIDVQDCERYGMRMASGTAGGVTYYPGAKFRGTISGCAERAIRGNGISYLELDPSCVFSGNGNAANVAAGTVSTVDIDNGTGNTNAGTFIGAGRFDSNQANCIKASALGYVDLTRGITGRDNCAAYSTAFHAIYIPSCVELVAASILLTNSLSKQSRVLKVDACTKAVIDRTSIEGDMTSTTAPKADVTATTLFGELVGTTTYDPASVAAGTWGASTTVSVPGAKTGDIVSVSFQAAGALLWFGAVSAADTVTIAPYNPTGAAIDFGNGNVRVSVRRLYGS